VIVDDIAPSLISHLMIRILLELSPLRCAPVHQGHSASGRVFLTPARHGPVGIDGDVVGFAIGTKQPGDLLYITGDTLWFDGTAEVSRRFSPKVVVLFTGAAEPRGRFHMTMGSEDALEAAAAFPAAALVSVHNEGWGHLKENQDQLADVFAKFDLANRLTRFDKGRPLNFAQ
jgi:L-ascorbate metabolism protein UlaG (beta-lactamase superfamily)